MGPQIQKQRFRIFHQINNRADRLLGSIRWLKKKVDYNKTHQSAFLLIFMPRFFQMAVIFRTKEACLAIHDETQNETQSKTSNFDVYPRIDF